MQQLDAGLQTHILGFAGVRAVLCTRLVSRGCKNAADSDELWPSAPGLGVGVASRLERHHRKVKVREKLERLLDFRQTLRQPLGGVPEPLARRYATRAAEVLFAGHCLFGAPLYVVLLPVFVWLFWAVYTLVTGMGAVLLLHLAWTQYPWAEALKPTHPHRRKLAAARESGMRLPGALASAAHRLGVGRLLFALLVVAQADSFVHRDPVPYRPLPARGVDDLFTSLPLAVVPLCLYMAYSALQHLGSYLLNIGRGAIREAIRCLRLCGESLCPIAVILSSFSPSPVREMTGVLSLFCSAGVAVPWEHEKMSLVAVFTLLWLPLHAAGYNVPGWGAGMVGVLLCRILNDWNYYRWWFRVPTKGIMRKQNAKEEQRGGIAWSDEVDFAASGGSTGCRSRQGQMKLARAARGGENFRKRLLAAANEKHFVCGESGDA
eukprot:Hpha_TRINITY_DN22503_c0_g1::TRINITY_DN22503_c0_g1_i1::g.185033::m.185033